MDCSVLWPVQDRDVRRDSAHWWRVRSLRLHLETVVHDVWHVRSFSQAVELRDAFWFADKSV